MKRHGEEVLTYRCMLKYVRENLQDLFLTEAEILHFIHHYEKSNSDNIRTLVTFRKNGKLETFNVYRKPGIIKMIEFTRKRGYHGSLKAFDNITWYEAENLSEVEVPS